MPENTGKHFPGWLTSDSDPAGEGMDSDSNAPQAPVTSNATPEQPSARLLLDRAVSLHTGGQYKAAIPFYVHAVRQAEVEALANGSPVDPDVLHAAGVALAMGGKRTEAVQFLEQAILNGKASSASVWSALGLAYVELRQLGKAERCYRNACQLDPASCANWTGYANLAYAGGNPTVGEQRYQRALNCPARDPEELIAQGMTWLRRGHWRKGWRAYEARTSTAMWHDRNPHASQLKQRSDAEPAFAHYTYWRTPKAGERVYVVSEQGLGDTVQFARYLRPFRERYDVNVTVGCNPALVDMLKGALPEMTVQSHADEVPGGVGGWALLLSLPAILRCSDAKSVPPAVQPFGGQWGKGTGSSSLSRDDAATQASPRLRVFVHGRGNAQHGYDFDRSAPGTVLEDAVTALGHEVVVAPFLNLAAAGEMQVQAEPSWKETVDCLMACDACVTVDTGLCHVAGSLGIPMLLAVPTIPEWRWGNPSQRKTVWYPSAVVVRRTRTDRWEEVTAAMKPFLEGLCAF